MGNWDLVELSKNGCYNNSKFTITLVTLVPNTAGQDPVNFKLTMVRSTSTKIMMAVEPATLNNPSDNRVPGNPKGVINDGRWAPATVLGTGDVLPKRHNGKAEVAFADGHAEAVPWYWCTNQSYIDPSH